MLSVSVRVAVLALGVETVASHGEAEVLPQDRVGGGVDVERDRRECCCGLRGPEGGVGDVHGPRENDLRGSACQEGTPPEGDSGA